MKTMQIEIPEGQEIDKITFKPAKPKLAQSWDDLGVIKGWYVDLHSAIVEVTHCMNDVFNKNIFATKAQAKSSLAMAQLSQLMKQANGDWVPDWTAEESKYCIERKGDSINARVYIHMYCFLAFKDRSTRDQFLKTHRPLIETYLMIPK